MTKTILRVFAAACAWAAFAAAAQTGSQEAEIKAAFEAADKVKVVGPASVSLRDQAMLKLPEGHIYVPMPQAGRLMQSMGNRRDDRLLGMVLPQGDYGWFVAIKFVQEGFVKDDDAKDWKADELLNSLREGTEAANQERTQRGFPALEVVGWAEPPKYDAGMHRLVWSASAREKGATGNQPQAVNYNTYALGRDGYISLNLITDLDNLDKHRPAALQLLGGLDYNDGKRYADFNRSTDKVAAYGLAALVAGAAAKKLGLLALIFAFAAKFAKVLVVAGGAALFGVGKLFGRKKTEA
jgi:uncharacterized membrane-anchored protein